jgi:transposase-like protein
MTNRMDQGGGMTWLALVRLVDEAGARIAALAQRLGVQRAGATRGALMHWAEHEEEREREKRGTPEQDP